MSDDDMRSTIADKRAAVTREAIVQATQMLLVNEHPAAISVPAVAREAGISVRTVYRYFPNKQALLDAVANYFPNRALGDGPRALKDHARTEDGLVRLWSAFADELPAVRAQHQSPAGAELRQRRLTETRTDAAKAVAELHPDALHEDRERLTDLLIAVTSSSMFLELTDRLGREPAESARLAMWAVRAMNDRFHRKGGLV